MTKRHTISALIFACSLSVLGESSAFAQQGSRGSHFFENWDTNKDGKVTLEESTKRRAEIFVTFDEDSDGNLSKEEYTTFDETRAEHRSNLKSQPRGSGRGSKGMMMEFNDTNKDGIVVKDEFIANTKRWFNLMDRNADGAITKADFGPR